VGEVLGEGRIWETVRFAGRYVLWWCVQKPNAPYELPLLAWRAAGRAFRKAARRIVVEDSARIHVDVTQWHDYEMQWLANMVRFKVDGRELLATALSPRGPLGLVIWIDNQYMAFPPDGRLRMGMLPVDREASLAMQNIRVE